jgi:hypothetical protein
MKDFQRLKLGDAFERMHIFHLLVFSYANFTAFFIEVVL